LPNGIRDNARENRKGEAHNRGIQIIVRQMVNCRTNKETSRKGGFFVCYGSISGSLAYQGISGQNAANGGLFCYLSLYGFSRKWLMKKNLPL